MVRWEKKKCNWSEVIQPVLYTIGGKIRKSKQNKKGILEVKAQIPS